MSSEEIDQELAEIMTLQQEMQVALGPLKEQREELESQIREIMDPFVLKIQEITERVEAAVLENAESFKGDHGKVTFRKSYPRYTWDNKALEGYAAAGHDELFQFRKESIVEAKAMVKAGE
ncbi:hypothetical protein [Methanococcoides sp. AM1]|uniref:hypothetical protein n=1 Tax=Methanococcoides sp. AM1 TaxID=1201011 RepID=UPI001082E254|nr:hypothetical protein [Methanococcoides sp. AM1]